MTVWALVVALLLPWQSTANYQHLGSCGKQIADSINTTRIEHGVKPLRISWKGHRIARAWTVHLRETKVVAHSFTPGWGENVGRAPDCETLIAAWWGSPAHADNALTPWYTVMGPGTARTTYDIYGAVEFG